MAVFRQSRSHAVIRATNRLEQTETTGASLPAHLVSRRLALQEPFPAAHAEAKARCSVYTQWQNLVSAVPAISALRSSCRGFGVGVEARFWRHIGKRRSVVQELWLRLHTSSSTPGAHCS